MPPTICFPHPIVKFTSSATSCALGVSSQAWSSVSWLRELQLEQKQQPSSSPAHSWARSSTFSSIHSYSPSQACHRGSSTWGTSSSWLAARLLPRSGKSSSASRCRQSSAPRCCFFHCRISFKTDSSSAISPAACPALATPQSAGLLFSHAFSCASPLSFFRPSGPNAERYRSVFAVTVAACCLFVTCAVCL